MTQMWQNENVSVFIGPDDKCTNEALVAAAWNIPMISYVSFCRFRWHLIDFRLYFGTNIYRYHLS